MSFTHSDLYAEIKELVRPQIETEQIVSAVWVVPLMEAKHPLPKTWRGDDADAWSICYREHIKHLARGIVREFKKTQDDPKPGQFTLPGFKFVQRSYQIERGDEPMIVPLPEMDDQEVEDKAEELDKMADGCRSHAAELRRYLRDRQASAAA